MRESDTPPLALSRQHCPTRRGIIPTRRGVVPQSSDIRGDAFIVLSVNQRAWALAKEATGRAEELRIAVRDLLNGTRVVDCGVDVAGGLEAGRLLSHLCMGGLGQLDFVPVTIDGESWPGVQVRTDHPAVCCMASQYAGWAITPDGSSASCSRSSATRTTS